MIPIWSFGMSMSIVDVHNQKLQGGSGGGVLTIQVDYFHKPLKTYSNYYYILL